ncbi:MAG: hypothetical protein GY820_39495 [Gammaproteobacteria bacterium]|nr:hypothetical protein [Gammaproteobacteria bacterium]
MTHGEAYEILRAHGFTTWGSEVDHGTDVNGDVGGSFVFYERTGNDGFVRLDVHGETVTDFGTEDDIGFTSSGGLDFTEFVVAL